MRFLPPTQAASKFRLSADIADQVRSHLACLGQSQIALQVMPHEDETIRAVFCRAEMQPFLHMKFGPQSAAGKSVRFGWRRHEMTPDELMEVARTWVAPANKYGNVSVYVAPVPQGSEQLVNLALLDVDDPAVDPDLVLGKLMELGLEPAAVVRTSLFPHDVERSRKTQFWLRFREQISADEQGSIQRLLASDDMGLGGDSGAAGKLQLGRLAGFFNRKLKYQFDFNQDAFTPLRELKNAPRSMLVANASKGAFVSAQGFLDLRAKARLDVKNRELAARVAKQLAMQPASGGKAAFGQVSVQQAVAQLDAFHRAYQSGGGTSISLSHLDFRALLPLADRGLSGADMEKALLAHEATQRKANPNQYAAKTADAVMAFREAGQKAMAQLSADPKYAQRSESARADLFKALRSRLFGQIKDEMRRARSINTETS